MGAKAQAQRQWRRIAAWRHELFEKPITVGSLIRHLITIAVTVVIVNGAVFRTADYNWLSGRDWGRSIAKSWPLIIGTLVLRQLDRAKGKNERKDQSRLRRLLSATAVDLIRIQNLKHDYTLEGMLRPRELLLRCVSMKVAEIIQERSPDKIVACLIELCDGEHESDMRVVARSLLVKPDTYYPKESTLAWESIKAGRMREIPDIRKDTRFLGVERTYRTVLAVPIVTRENHAVAAISIDYTRPYGFAGHCIEIEECLQPFAAGFLLTYGENSIKFPCAYDRATPSK